MRIVIITQKTAYKYIPKKKFRCFDLKPDGPFSAECLSLKIYKISKKNAWKDYSISHWSLEF